MSTPDRNAAWLALAIESNDPAIYSLSDAAWDSYFRSTGKDREFNSYIAFKRLHIALIELAHNIARPIFRLICPHHSRSWTTVQVTDSMTRTTGGCTDCGKPMPPSCGECGK